MVSGRVFITRVASAILLLISRKLSVRAADDAGALGAERGASTGAERTGSASATRGLPTIIGVGVALGEGVRSVTTSSTRGDGPCANTAAAEPEMSVTLRCARQDLIFIRWYYR